uniref:Protein kinase domain-containing protein n=1 Tax=Leersia perrieri TaxID=77586 RepID=A0A0D9XCN6_9ORYZ
MASPPAPAEDPSYRYVILGSSPPAPAPTAAPIQQTPATGSTPAPAPPTQPDNQSPPPPPIPPSQPSELEAPPPPVEPPPPPPEPVVGAPSPQGTPKTPPPDDTALRTPDQITTSSPAKIIAMAVAPTVVVFVVAAVLLWLWWQKRRKNSASVRVPHNSDSESDGHHGNSDLEKAVTAGGPRRYQYQELAAATGDFAEEKKLGQGGFGHLHGWCDSRKGLLLVYEFVPGGSLEKHIYDTNRYKIIMGLGAALRYLHQEWEKCVLHGDIKPSNIMVDLSCNTKLGDFGLARLVDHGKAWQATTSVFGTAGYIDPEFVITRKPSIESDVYSFGIVLLEIICAKPPIVLLEDKPSFVLLKWVWSLYSQNTILDAVDERLRGGGMIDEWQMERVLVVGLWCAHPDLKERPSITRAINMLQSDDARLPYLSPQLYKSECSPPPIDIAIGSDYGNTTHGTFSGTGIPMSATTTTTCSSVSFPESGGGGGGCLLLCVNRFASVLAALILRSRAKRINFSSVEVRNTNAIDIESNGDRSNNAELEIVVAAAGPRRYNYDELSAATGDFAEEEKLGQGGFGSVYRGRLPGGGQQPPSRRLPMDWGSCLLRALPDRSRGANYTLLLVAERTSSLAVNFVVDGPVRTGLSSLSSEMSPLVCNQNRSLGHGASRFIVLIVTRPSGKGVASCRYILPWNIDEQEELLDSSGVMAMSGTLPERRVRIHRSSLTLSSSNRVLPKTRRLLSGSHGHILSRKQQRVAIYRPGHRTRQIRESMVVAGLSLLGLICAIMAGVLCCTRQRKRVRQIAAAMVVELDEFEDDKPILKPEQYRGVMMWPKRFRYSEMAAATRNFAEETKIGRGGFGPVYRGYLNDEQRYVAIKVLTEGEQSQQGMREFQAELTVMSQVRHRNIVQLLGWCDCRRGLFLVYELMPEGSLDKHLYDTNRLLSWPNRYNIAIGLGSALQYLHQDCNRCVVHGDIKPANVMLDTSLNPKLGDFGLARLLEHGAEPDTTQVIAGTVGYIDPEFLNSHIPSAESDVYSFGVVLLEIASGRRPASSRRQDTSLTLLDFVRRMYDRGTVVEAADGRLNGEFDKQQMERMLVTGLWCACHDPTYRPSVTQAVKALRSEGADLRQLPVITPVTRAVERSLVEQAYGDQSEDFSMTDPSTTYLTSRDPTWIQIVN